MILPVTGRTTKTERSTSGRRASAQIGTLCFFSLLFTLTAVDDKYLKNHPKRDDVFGMSLVEPRAILQYLTTTYGRLSDTDIEANRKKLEETWDPNLDIADLWVRIDDIKATAALAGDEHVIPDGIVISKTIMALTKAGPYEHLVRTWRDKPVKEQTMAAFILHVNHQEKIRLELATAGGAGYANHVQDTPMSSPWRSEEKCAKAVTPSDTQRKLRVEYTCIKVGDSFVLGL